MANEFFQHYLNIVTREHLYSNKANLKFHLNTLFSKINFVGKHVLDVGGGAGVHSFFAAVQGATEVICLEPEAEGSEFGVTSKFMRIRSDLAVDNVQLVKTTLQSFDPEDRTFDIVILHDSINHLDESACINLKTDPISRKAYINIFSKLAVLTQRSGNLIACDCSSSNFFAFLRITNFLYPEIEWRKHQPPQLWIELFAQVGFLNPRIVWTSPNRLGYLGKLILANKPASYFLNSHFCLTMDKG